MAQFLLLLHDAPSDFEGMSAEDLESVIGEYVAWRENLESRNLLLGANKLADEGGKDLSLIDGKLRVVDGPYSEAKEVMGGYFLIEAVDYDEAVEFSAGCPHLKYGRRIELRQIDDSVH